MAFTRVSASQLIPVRSRWSFVFFFYLLFFFFFSLLASSSPPSLCEVIFSSLPARHRSAAAALLLFPDINYVPVGRTLRRWTHRCVSLTSAKGDPGARLVIPRRGRRNPCVRSLRSYKVQFKKILSSLVSTAQSRYTILPHFLLLFFQSCSSNKSHNSRYPLTSLAWNSYGFLFVILFCTYFKREYKNVALRFINIYVYICRFEYFLIAIIML